jgi:Tol biopolymer transport system component
MELTMRRTLVRPRWLYAFVVLALGLFLALALGFAMGQQPKLPPVNGGARNGMIVDDSDGRISEISDQNLAPAGVLPLTPPDVFAVEPVFSPDGTRVAYFGWPHPSGPLPSDGQQGLAGQLWHNVPASLYIANADGSNAALVGTQLGTLLHYDLEWSHDGGRLAVHYQDSSGQDWLDVVDTQSLSRLVHTGGRTPVWSPDGSRIAFQMDGVGVFLLNADGTDPTQLTHVPGTGSAFQHPVFSPDGKTVAFYAGDDGSHTIWLIGVDGSNPRQLPRPTSTYEAYWPAFSPDGTQLEFNQVVDTNNEIQFAVADADGSNVKLLPSAPLWPMADAWSPDGHYLVSYQGAGVAPDSLDVVDVTGVDPVRTFPSRSVSGYLNWQRLAP